MGIEYQIRFTPPSAESLDAEIRGLPCFRDFDAQSRLYNLDLDPSQPLNPSHEMPDAFVQITEDGLYFCDNRSSKMTPIKESILALARRYDPKATLEEL